MITITNNPDGSVTARDEATGIEGNCKADEASEGRREQVAEFRLATALRKHERARQDGALQRGMG